MKSLDVLNQEKVQIVQKMQDAFKAGDTEAYSAAMTEFFENIRDQVFSQYEGQRQTADANVLASRGVRQLTSEEHEYFQKLGDAMRSENPKQALAELEVVMPKTEINAVFEDLTAAHPLLEFIDFQNTSGLTEIIYNTHEDQLGTWETLTSAIAQELTSGFKKVPLSMEKYSAFIPVAKSMLDLGPEWLETYVRTILQETIYLGLEEAIINGDGNKKPIGMNRQVGESVNVVGGVYPEKAAVPVTSLDPVTYGAMLSQMTETPNGHQRVVDKVLMVVSPKDYFRKIMPATTIRGADGTYQKDVLPYSTEIVQSVYVPEGRMILGLPKRYYMGIGTAKSGKIEYSDEYHFLEDERVYLCKLYGHGEPKDNSAFLYCDISGLEPAVLKVEVVSKNAADAGTP